VAAVTTTIAGCHIVLGLEDTRVDDDAGLNDNAALAGLDVSRGQLDPPFDPEVTEYRLTLSLGAVDLAITPTAAEPGVSIEISAMPVESGSTSAPVALGLGDNLVEIVVTPDAGEPRVYAITANRGAGALQQAYVKASNTGAGDRFGQSVAIDGDTLVVGAPAEDSAATGLGGDETDDSATGAGAVYVFARSGGVWAQQAYLKASNTEAGDSFGQTVALDGDTLVVGADDEGSAATGIDGDQTDNTASQAGAVYVFTRSGTTWSQQAYIKASNAEAADLFGQSVALSGDTLAVGARGEDSASIGGDQTDNGASSAGAVYVFTRSGTTWSQQAYIKASNPDSSDAFGFCVAVDGETLAVCAPAEDSNATGVGGDQTDDSATGAGAVYVFTRSGTAWSQQAYIKASNANAGDNFGSSIGLSGDTLAVGAPLEDSDAGGQQDNSTPEAGAVYVFARGGVTWSQQAFLKASNAGTNDFFGAVVGLAGDGLAVGATGEGSAATGVGGDATDDSSAGAGAAYLFTREGGSWSQLLYIKASNTGVGDGFGSVALAGDSLVVGANSEGSAATGASGGATEQADNSADGAGAVYVFQ
jgi:hypothetical protein